ncbi:CPBP family intramembrane glutamic endopeptidase [Anaerosacchariphilus polymeriproducens]|uniref:CPBP family intramembrane metalloprotease n=1 Tax=Anaerosacchariphilus polymeriproducens TaxID=1812858 RepID=A0A371ASJ2_9FIRM|nr:type II CAAX endopeptidase family protein [Anaerosacchariphilus polymeriproducens]RDU22543.1 CPBP family intramembrane metalloprotease [Anaerosacchariphilus polymeriproducens]
MYSEEKTLKKLFKKDINKIAITLILYDILLMSVYTLYVIVEAAFQMIKNPKFDVEAFTDSISRNGKDGVAYLVGIGLGLFLIYALRKKELFTYDLKVSRRKMHLKEFVIFLSCFMAPQILFLLLGNGLESVFNHFGYTIMNDMKNASAGSNGILMFLYASFFGPISEEIIFRGAILRKLEKHGRVFAIIVSAALFGLFHGNLVQGIFAASVGLVLGYVAMEYSIKWSMVLHIINNFIFGDLFLFLTKGMNETVTNVIFYAMLVVFTLIAIFFIFKYRKQIAHYLNVYATRNKKKYKYIFTSVWMIIFILICLFMAMEGIEKLT